VQCKRCIKGMSGPTQCPYSAVFVIMATAHTRMTLQAADGKHLLLHELLSSSQTCVLHYHLLTTHDQNNHTAALSNRPAGFSDSGT
jgi:transposase